MAEAQPVRRARAKVNLDLLITGRRADGYHELDSLVVFAEACDLLEVGPAPGLTLAVDGPFAAAVAADEGNLVLAAARHLAELAGIEPRAAIRLTKRLPVAAGLGGGSADAAATLHALNELWGTALPAHQLLDLALPLGADVPVCVHGRPARMRGIGERLDPVTGLPDLPLLLVNPGIPLATADVFRALWLADDLSERAPFPPFPSLLRLAAWLAESDNDLEAPALALAPGLADTLELLRRLPGSLVTRMSGSGSTCWALFASADELAAAAGQVAEAQPGWWCHGETVPGGP